MILAIAGVSQDAMALGFGRSNNSSHLGQSLDFSVLLRFDVDEFVSSECVVAEVYSGDDRVLPSNVRVAIDAPLPSGERMLHVSTGPIIEEPVVTVNLSVGCPARLTRKFVAFVDPPALNLAQAAPLVTAAPAIEPGAAPASAPDVAIAPPPMVRRPDPEVAQAQAQPPAKSASAPARRARPPRAVVRRQSGDTVVAAAASQAPRNKLEVPQKPAIVAAATSGARLQLEAPPPAPPVTPVVTAKPGTPAASAPLDATADVAAQVAAALAATLPPSAVANAASNAQANADQARMHALEESLAKLRSDTDATRSNVASLQSRLHEAESQRYSNPLVYALLALAAVLLIALAALLLWARKRERERAAWWAGEGQETVARRAAVIPEFDDAAPAEPAALPAPAAESPTVSVSAPATVATGPVTWKPTVSIPELDTRDVRKREVSADELIDLEQQAEFFVTLGQDDAAIDLLSSHIASSGGASPMPYLKLLEIHRRNGDAAAYTGVREQFNQRFNGYAPAIDEFGAAAHPLEEHADVMSQVQQAWPTPPRAMGVLESLLMRPSGDSADAAFDLDAYREVLFLYEIARDLSGVGERIMVVDFELPLSDTPASAMFVTEALRATQPITPRAEVMRPMHVDVDLSLPVGDASYDRPRGAK